MVRAKQRIRDAGLPYDVPDTAATANQTDGPKVLGRYGGLQRAAPSPVVQLNRAVAVSVVQGPAAGEGAGRLHLAHVAHADMLRQLGDLAGTRA